MAPRKRLTHNTAALSMVAFEAFRFMSATHNDMREEIREKQS